MIGEILKGAALQTMGGTGSHYPFSDATMMTWKEIVNSLS
jgi:hypothetical protein